MRRCLFGSTVLFALGAAACGGAESSGPTGSPQHETALPGTPIAADPQRPGDPAKGYTALVNNGYVSCGVPYSAYSKVYGPAPAAQRLPGRNGINAELPYAETAFQTSSGVEVVSENCLACHAGYIRGELVVGLGDTQQDFTVDFASYAAAAGLLISDPAEKGEFEKWLGRVQAIGPYIQTASVGVNPADTIAAVLFAHRDPQTLAWSDSPLIPLPPPTKAVPVDVPPWWRMAKKNAMFYVGAGRGDHARIEMTASTLCTDSVDEAKAIDAYFPDIAAFIASIEPPAYPFAVDANLAEHGRTVFDATCSMCHGTYVDGGHYPNLLISLKDVGTDPTIASGATQFASPFVHWFNASFYGELAHLDPQPGYVAPPLDGIWATAPYLHNGSVPTLAALLDSKTRPQYWYRKYDASGQPDSNDYDDVAVGWSVTSLDHGQAAEPNATLQKHIYDTTLPGYSNAGHTFGDALSPDDRAAVIEYLKTL